jgi:hypothetical protein
MAVSPVAGWANLGTIQPSRHRSQLRQSMLALIKSSERAAHPAIWAPFVVVGEGGR